MPMELFREPLARKYYASRWSIAYCYYLLAVAAAVLVPWRGAPTQVCTEFQHCTSVVNETDCTGDNGWTVTDPYHPESSITIPRCALQLVECARDADTHAGGGARPVCRAGRLDASPVSSSEAGSLGPT